MINNMGRGFCAAMMAGLFALPFQAQAATPQILVGDKIRFADSYGDNDTGGGLFNLSVYSTTSTSTLKGSFLSLCVERDEHISFGSTYYNVAGISKAANNGGNNVPGVGSDPLDVRTAWLYTNYMETPTALNSVGTWATSGLDDRGTALQLAVWLFEEEINAVTAFGSQVNANATSLASALVAAAGAAGWTDTGRVYALNMTTLSGGVAQDQLYIMPVPEPSTYALLAAGLGLLGWAGRRNKA